MLNSYKDLDDVIWWKKDVPIYVSKNILFERLNNEKVSKDELALLIEELKDKTTINIIGATNSILALLVSVSSLLISGYSLFYQIYTKFEDNLGKKIPNNSLIGKTAMLVADFNSISRLEHNFSDILRVIIVIFFIIIAVGIYIYFRKQHTNRILSYLYTYKRYLIRKDSHKN